MHGFCRVASVADAEEQGFKGLEEEENEEMK